MVSALGSELLHQNEKLCKLEGEEATAKSALLAAEVRFPHFIILLSCVSKKTAFERTKR